MATGSSQPSRLTRLWRSLCGAGYRGADGRAGTLAGIPVFFNGNPESRLVVVLSPGFAGRLTDYGLVVKALERQALVVRVYHPRNGRLAGLLALLRLLYHRFWGRLSDLEAARLVRGHIHRMENCDQRAGQLEAVVQALESEARERDFVLLGHSFGTDTVLRVALRREVAAIVLLSPHPPGYLIPGPDYRCLKTQRVGIFTGTKDRTRDGVGPKERLEVTKALGTGYEVNAVCFPEVSHMDFALEDLGPMGWEVPLETELKRVVFSEREPAI